MKKSKLRLGNLNRLTPKPAAIGEGKKKEKKKRQKLEPGQRLWLNLPHFLVNLHIQPMLEAIWSNKRVLQAENLKNQQVKKLAIN